MDLSSLLGLIVHIDLLEDGYQNGNGEQAQQAGHHDPGAAGEHTAHIGIDDGCRSLAKAGSKEEGPELQGGQTGKIADGIKGYKGQQTADQNGLGAVLLKIAFHTCKRTLACKFSTTSRPRPRASRKHRAEPTMAEDQDRMAPCHQPKMAALERVIMKAGSGAIKEENTIRKKEKTMA